MPCEAVGYVRQADITAVPVDDEGKHAVHGHVRGEHDCEGITRDGDVAEHGPYPGRGVRCRGWRGLGTCPVPEAGVPVPVVSLLVPTSAQETDGEARGYVGQDGQPDEEGFRQTGLVELAGHEEEGLGVRDGAVDERYQGGVGEVQAGEQGEGVARVALDAGYWSCANERLWSLLSWP